MCYKADLQSLQRHNAGAQPGFLLTAMSTGILAVALAMSLSVAAGTSSDGANSDLQQPETAG